VSLLSTPFAFKSIPSAGEPFAKMALPSSVLELVAAPPIHTPSAPLCAMVLPAPAAVPPTVLLWEPWSNEIPRLRLPIAPVPFLSVPIRFACTTVVAVPALLIVIPCWFAEITLPAPTTPIVLPVVLPAPPLKIAMPTPPLPSPARPLAVRPM